MRLLSKKFTTYALGKWEKATGKGIAELLNIGNLEVNKIADIIKLGNKDVRESKDPEEAAYDILDEYLGSDESHTIMTAFLDLVDDLDHDVKVLMSMGISSKQFRESVEKQLEEVSKAAKSALESGVDKAVEKVQEVDNKVTSSGELDETVDKLVKDAGDGVKLAGTEAIDDVKNKVVEIVDKF